MGIVQQFINWIIDNGGFYVLLLVIFAESGLLLGFFFPGDSLLFAAGIWSDKLAVNFFNVHYSVLIIILIIASILGNMVGFWFGRKTGPLLYSRKDTWLFKKKHLARAHDFYEQYGKGTIFLAKFLPIIRTFAPIVAGIVKMDKKTFHFYNVIGSICWVSSMMLAGHFLQTWVENKYGYSLKDHIEAITIVIILITTLPVIYKLFFGKKKQPADNA